MTTPRSTGSGRRRAPAAGPPAPRRPLSSRAAQPRPPAEADALEPRRLLATFTVTTTADAGPGSLRQAILDANAAEGADTIRFNVGTRGTPATIRPQSPLPAVTGPMTLWVETDWSFPQSIQVEIDGSLAGPNADGLVLAAAPSAVYGLAINGFSGNGIVVRTAAGSPPATTNQQIRIENSFIGTNAAGDAAQPNGGAGVVIEATAPSTVVSRSVISGNLGHGVAVLGAPKAVIQSNRIGINLARSAAIGNGGDGVFATDGGPIHLSWNTISGNRGNGVRFVRRTASAGEDWYVYRNYIGTSGQGNTALANGGNGLVLDACRGVRLQYPPLQGELQFIPFNTVSGNRGHGIVITGAGSGPSDIVLFGADAGGLSGALAALGNGGSGIYIAGASGITITNGGYAGNGGDGITITSLNGVPSTNITLRDNIVGGFPGVWSIPARPQDGNHGDGIAITDSSRVNVRGNEIGFNRGAGVSIRQTAQGVARENTIAGNSIFSNGGLAIDLVPAGASPGQTPNDAGDDDVGPNDVLNYPEVTDVEFVRGFTYDGRGDWRVSLTLSSRPNQIYNIELFATPGGNSGLPPSSHVGTYAVSTDADGRGAITVDVGGMPGGTLFTATATTARNTSEMSPGVRAWTPRPTVVGRHIFYNNSKYDGNRPQAEARDDAAIDFDRDMLLPGQSMTSWNVTNYSRGINGMMIDVTDLPDIPLTVDAFDFRVGNNSEPDSWQPAPTPAIAVRRDAGVGGSDRITLTWPDAAIRNQWLRVTLRHGVATGIASDDVFYFGNIVGETFHDPDVWRVTLADARRTIERADPNRFWDFNRDGKTDHADYVISRRNLFRSLHQLVAPAIIARLMHRPRPASPPSAAFPESSAGDHGALLDCDSASPRALLGECLFRCEAPLTPTLSPGYRGEGANYDSAANRSRISSSTSSGRSTVWAMCARSRSR